jgi:hypothetical protein
VRRWKALREIGREYVKSWTRIKSALAGSTELRASFALTIFQEKLCITELFM